MLNFCKPQLYNSVHLELGDKKLPGFLCSYVYLILPVKLLAEEKRKSNIGQLNREADANADTNKQKPPMNAP
jgi:hypothetical protein